MQVQNKQQQISMSHRIYSLQQNKKANNSINSENNRELFQNHNEDNTFYSPVKYFSNNLQAHSQKAQQDISPWQTQNDDQLNILGMDFCKKGKSIKDKRMHFNKEIENIYSYKPNLNSYQFIKNHQQNINNEDLSENMQNTTYEQTFRNKSTYINLKELQKRNESDNKIIKKFNVQQERNYIKNNNTFMSNQQIINFALQNNKQNEFQSLEQQEIQQQNQLIASIRRQKNLYQHQIQQRRLFSEELSKTGVETTPRQDNSFQDLQQNRNISSQNIIQKENLSDKNLNKLKIDENSKEVDYEQNDISDKEFDESITIKNKNKILSLLEKALNKQKRNSKVENQIKNPLNSFYSLSHKASMIQRNLILTNSQKKKQKLLQINKIGVQKDEYQKHNITQSNTHIEDSSIFLKKQYKTLENNNQSLKGYTFENNEEFDQNDSFKVIKQNQYGNGNESSILINLSNKINSSSNINDKKSILQSQNIRSRALSHLISKNTDNKINISKKLLKDDSQIKSTTNGKLISNEQYENNQIYINKKYLTTININKKQDIQLNKENLYQQFENEHESLLTPAIDQSGIFNPINNQSININQINNLFQMNTYQSSNTNLKCSDQVLKQQKSIDLLLPLFKGKKSNKDYKKVMKKLQKIQNASPLYKNIDNNHSVNKISLCNTEEVAKQNEINNIQQNSLPQIIQQQQQTNRKKVSHSFQTDQSNTSNVHSMLVQGMNKIMNIQSYQANNFHQLYDNSVYLNQIKREAQLNRDNQEIFQTEESNQDESKIDQNVKEFNQYKKKSFLSSNQDKINNPLATPRILSIQNSKSLPQQQNLKSNNISYLKSADIPFKKQQDYITQQKISSNQGLVSCSQHSYSIHKVNFPQQNIK